MARPSNQTRAGLAALQEELASFRPSMVNRLAPALEILGGLLEVDAVGYITFEPASREVRVERAASSTDPQGAVAADFRDTFNAHTSEERLSAFRCDPR